jgi:hypothetical protein
MGQDADKIYFVLIASPLSEVTILQTNHHQTQPCLVFCSLLSVTCNCILYSLHPKLLVYQNGVWNFLVTINSRQITMLDQIGQFILEKEITMVI